jgi:GNAT superfamily N-acetyltransferase
MVEIKTATIQDAKALSELLVQLGYKNDVKFIQNHMERFLNQENDILFVAMEDQKVVGFISIHFIPQIALEGDFCRISYFSVNSENRNNGIGNLLESHAVKIAKERKCDRIEVHCHSRREEAHRFYFKQGYEESPKYLMKSLKD